MAVRFPVADPQDGKGKLNVSYAMKAEGENLDFTNVYDATATATLSGTKAIVGRDFKGGDEATFKIVATGDNADRAPMPEEDTVTVSPTVGASVAFAFGDITYAISDIPDGKASETFTYKVTEESCSMAGVEGTDETAYEVSITISNKRDGTLEVVKSDSCDALVFTNNYKAEATLALKGAKSIDKRDILEGDSFTFQVAEVKGEGASATRTILQTVTLDAMQRASSLAIPYEPIAYTYDESTGVDDRGKHTYEVIETAASAAGVTKSETKRTFTVGVTDNGDGKLLVQVTDGSASGLDFTNNYEAKNSVTFQGAKSIDKRALKAGDTFEFTVTDKFTDLSGETTTTEVAKVSNDETGVIAYPRIDYVLNGERDDRGTHVYTITETHFDSKGVRSDDGAVQTVTVHVTSDGTSTLVVDVDEADRTGNDFVNLYAAEGSTTFEGTKSIDNRAMTAADVFQFSVVEVDEDGNAVRDGLSETVVNDAATGRIDYPTITYTIDDLWVGGELKESRDYFYKVSERNVKADGITSDTNAYTVKVTVKDTTEGVLDVTTSEVDAKQLDFVNHYEATGKATLKGTKNIEGRSYQDGDSATMKIEAVTKGAPMPANDTVTVEPKRGTTVSFAFGDIGYKLSDLDTDENGLPVATTFLYKVTESAQTMAGVQNADGKVYNVTVKVSDIGDGTLDVQTSDDAEELDFTNVYTASGELNLSGHKSITNKPASMDLSGFKFTVTEDGGRVATGVSDKDGNITFTTIKYDGLDAAGTHVYEVAENETDKPGVTIAQNPVIVTVKVTDDKAGHLTATSSGKVALDAVDFTNVYDATGSVELKGTKALENRAMTDSDNWAFTIEPVNGAPLRDSVDARSARRLTASNDGTADFGFGELWYKLSDLTDTDEVGRKTGTFTYTVTESGRITGVTNDAAPKTVTITATDKGDGTLDVQSSVTDKTPLAFVNTYNAKGSVEIRGTKEMVGRAFQAGDEWKFTISSEDKSAPLPAETEVTVKASDKASFKFQKIAYDVADLAGVEADADGTRTKTFTYTVTESGKVAGVTNDSPKTVEVTVTDRGEGALEVETDAPEDGLTFQNTYHASGVTELTGTKKIAGRTFKDGDSWTFFVTAAEGVPMPEQRSITINPQSGKSIDLDFGEIAFTEADSGNTYVYTVAEVGSVQNVTNDAAKTVTVDVADNGDGTLAVTSSCEEEPLEFENTYNAEGETTLKGTKTISGRQFKPGDRWTFEVSADDEATPMPEHTSVTIEPVEGSSAEVDFGTIAFTQEDLEDAVQGEDGKRTKTFEYTITESGEVAGVTNAKSQTVSVTVTDDGKGKISIVNGTSEQPLVFENTYKAEGSTTFSGTKKLIGRSFMDSDAWTFEVSAADGTPMPNVTSVTVKPATSEAYSFGPIRYTEADAGKTYTYTITETGEVAGVTNGKAKTVVVKVSDNGDGTLGIATFDEKGQALDSSKLGFDNTYSASGKLELSGHKSIKNKPASMDLSGFKFTVTENGEQVAAGESGKDGAIAFDEISYPTLDSVGTHTYVISEDNDTKDGVTNTAETQIVKVEVTDNGDGTLKAEAAKGSVALGAVDFENEYSAGGSTTLQATKAISGRNFQKGDEWTFTVTADEGTPMPAKTSVTITPESGSEAVVDFGKVAFTEADAGKTYTYTIAETGTVAGVTNDSAAKTVIVTVADNGDGKLEVTAAPNANDLVFTNVYEASGELTLKGTKSIIGRDFKQGDTATITLEAVTSDAPMPAEAELTLEPTSGSATNFEFAPISYDLADIPEGQTSATYVYKVTESAQTMDGVKKADDTVYEVEVTISDKGDGTLNVAASDNAKALDFINKYSATGSVTLKGTKTIDKRDIKEGDSFTFSVVEVSADGSTRTSVQNVKVDMLEAASSVAIPYGALEYTYDENTDDRGTHRYEVSETTTSADGVTKSEAVHSFTVEVSDKTDGTLETKVEGDDTAALNFRNTYRAEGSITFGGTKTIDKRAIKDGEHFEFEVREGENVVATGRSDANGNIAFDSIEYVYDAATNDLGEHNYVVSEATYDKDGVKSSEKTYEFVVTVSDNKDGTLKVDAPDLSKKLDFINAYTAEGSVTFEGEKTISTRDLVSSDHFSFQITEVDEHGQPVTDGFSAVVSNNSEGDIEYPTINYTIDDLCVDGAMLASRDYYYEVHELASDNEGIGIDEKSHVVHVTISDAKDGTLNVATSKHANELNFMNTYEAKGEVKFTGHKTIVNKPASMDLSGFTFTVKEDDKVVSTGESDADGNITFDEIDYDDLSAVGTHTYKITEDATTKPGVTTSHATVTVRVTVTDDTKGTLVAEPANNSVAFDAVDFENIYDATGSVEIEGTKALVGRALTADDKWTYTLTAEGGAPLRTDVDDETVDSVKATNDMGAIAFDTLYYKLTDLKKDESGSYVETAFTYTITESGEVAGVTNDSAKTVTVTVKDGGHGKLVATSSTNENPLVFTNTYEAKGETKLTANKTLTGREFQKGDQWTFTVTADEGAPMPAKTSVAIAPESGNAAAIDFGKVSFTEADAGKTYTYTIAETGEVAGVTNDSAKAVTVTVADNGDGTLKVTNSADEEPVTFENVYEAEGETTLKGAKTLSGREFRAGDQWTFTVTADEGTPMPAKTSVTIAPESGSSADVDFGKISFTEADAGKTYNYTITETGTVAGVTNDAAKVVTVKVEDGGDGTLKVTSSTSETPLVFANTYEAEGETTLEATKTITGREFKAGDQWTFTVTAAEGTPMPEKAEVTITPESGSTAAVDFGKVAFTEADAGKTYTYTIAETGTVAGVTNDSAKTVTVKVEDNGDGTLKVTNSADENPVTFANTYEAVAETQWPRPRSAQPRPSPAASSRRATSGPSPSPPTRAPRCRATRVSPSLQYPALPLLLTSARSPSPRSTRARPTPTRSPRPVPSRASPTTPPRP